MAFVINPMFFEIGIRQTKESMRPIALESSNLGKLPAELIRKIPQFLPLESVASFALSCRPIYFMLETPHFKELKSHMSLIGGCHHIKFLSLLVVDLPGYIACVPCNTLHAIDRAEQHLPLTRNLSSYQKWPKCWSMGQNTEEYFHANFSPTIFYMTMKLHRRGLDCSKHLELLSQEETFAFCEPIASSYCTAYTGEVYGVSVADAQIAADGSLILRKQEVLLSGNTPLFQPRSYITVCPHIRSTPWKEYDSDVVQWDFSPKEGKPKNKEGFVRCKQCLTDLHIGYKAMGKRHMATIITKWQDLGKGERYGDEKWWRHVDWKDSKFLYECDDFTVPLHYDRGSIYARFEGEEHGMFECERVLSAQGWDNLHHTLVEWEL